MRTKTQESKLALRLKIRALLKQMAPDQRAEASLRAAGILEKQVLWQKARSILFYAPTREELDVWPLVRDSLAGGKTVALPRFDPDANHYVACRLRDPAADLRSGQFGIREPAEHCAPIDLKAVDLVLVPGVAFDLSGRRLGRGKGFYDRLLALVGGTTCGMAFDEQIVDEVPVESHDIRVGCILTPTRWIGA